MKSIIL